MTFHQAILFGILAVAIPLFVRGPWRYDVVALGALMIAVTAGVVPAEDAFSGFGHPATITVASVLIISRALSTSGAVDILSRAVAPAEGRTRHHVAALSGTAAALSGVMNNVAALGLLMPIAIQSSLRAERSPAIILMPLAFCSILGGLVTLIGTPPNIIIAAYREQAVGQPFQMFDFTPVGAAVAFIGVVFVVLIGWRFLPRRRLDRNPTRDLFDIGDYVAEVRIPKGSDLVGLPMREAADRLRRREAVFAGLIRGERRIPGPIYREWVAADDIFVLEAGPDELDKIVTDLKLEIVGTEEDKVALLRSDDVGLMEVVVPPSSKIEGRMLSALDLGPRFRINVLAAARQGQRRSLRLRTFILQPGDVLLLQGGTEGLGEAVSALGLLPLAGRELQLSQRAGRPWTAIGIFAAAIATAVGGLLPIQIALGLGVVALILARVLPTRELYEGIDWPVIVLLGGMIPIGAAFESSGATGLVARAVLAAGGGASPVALLTLVLVFTMTVSDVLNNAATAVVMAPIALGLAQGLGVSPDPFLMAVAVGASSAFLTPIGHQNNTLVMGPGGYSFGDYWRLGLPLEILIVLVAVPMIVLVWPL